MDQRQDARREGRRHQRRHCRAKAAIAAHRVLYFPSGFYPVTDTLTLRPDTVLIGLHPSTTQIVLPDSTAAYQGVGAPKALIEAPKGGDNIVVGLGLFTGGINARATALLWKAGAASLVDDVKIQGGHGTFLADGSRFDPSTRITPATRIRASAGTRSTTASG